MISISSGVFSVIMRASAPAPAMRVEHLVLAADTVDLAQQPALPVAVPAAARSARSYTSRRARIVSSWSSSRWYSSPLHLLQTPALLGGSKMMWYIAPHSRQVRRPLKPLDQLVARHVRLTT